MAFIRQTQNTLLYILREHWYIFLKQLFSILKNQFFSYFFNKKQLFNFFKKKTNKRLIHKIFRTVFQEIFQFYPQLFKTILSDVNNFFLSFLFIYFPFWRTKYNYIGKDKCQLRGFHCFSNKSYSRMKISCVKLKGYDFLCRKNKERKQMTKFLQHFRHFHP